jgi:hypothetical protein
MGQRPPFFVPSLVLCIHCTRLRPSFFNGRRNKDQLIAGRFPELLTVTGPVSNLEVIDCVRPATTPRHDVIEHNLSRIKHLVTDTTVTVPFDVERDCLSAGYESWRSSLP